MLNVDQRRTRAGLSQDQTERLHRGREAGSGEGIFVSFLAATEELRMSAVKQKVPINLVLFSTTSSVHLGLFFSLGLKERTKPRLKLD